MTASRQGQRRGEGRLRPAPRAHRPGPAEGQHGAAHDRAAIGGAREGDDERVEAEHRRCGERRRRDHAAARQQRQDEGQRHRRIDADIAAAEMHARERGDDAVGVVEIEPAGKEQALIERGDADERQSRRHAGGEEARGVGAGIQRAPQERQQHQREEKSLRHAQRIVGAKLGDVGAAGRAGQGQAAGDADGAAQDRQRHRPAGDARHPEIAAPRRRAQRQHGDGDEHDEVRLLDEAPSRPRRQVEGRQHRRHHDEPRDGPAPQHCRVEQKPRGQEIWRHGIARHRQDHERRRAGRDGAAQQPRAPRRRAAWAARRERGGGRGGEVRHGGFYRAGRAASNGARECHVSFSCSGRTPVARRR